YKLAAAAKRRDRKARHVSAGKANLRANRVPQGTAPGLRHRFQRDNGKNGDGIQAARVGREYRERRPGPLDDQARRQHRRRRAGDGTRDRQGGGGGAFVGDWHHRGNPRKRRRQAAGGAGHFHGRKRSWNKTCFENRKDSPAAHGNPRRPSLRATTAPYATIGISFFGRHGQ